MINILSEHLIATTAAKLSYFEGSVPIKGLLCLGYVKVVFFTIEGCTSLIISTNISLNFSHISTDILNCLLTFGLFICNFGWRRSIVLKCFSHWDIKLLLMMDKTTNYAVGLFDCQFINAVHDAEAGERIFLDHIVH